MTGSHPNDQNSHLSRPGGGRGVINGLLETRPCSMRSILLVAVQRAIYKDFVRIHQTSKLLDEAMLRKKVLSATLFFVHALLAERASLSFALAVAEVVAFRE